MSGRNLRPCPESKPRSYAPQRPTTLPRRCMIESPSSSMRWTSQSLPSVSVNAHAGTATAPRPIASGRGYVTSRSLHTGTSDTAQPQRALPPPAGQPPAAMQALPVRPARRDEAATAGAGALVSQRGTSADRSRTGITPRHERVSGSAWRGRVRGGALLRPTYLLAVSVRERSARLSRLRRPLQPA